ncbi:hypothetical protein BDE36_1057 [Arcticibacter tournemirensis]|uniref:Uncharacterized protein n=1 Tax=Arcticibacter tournemirensis TaxID=699437 RepID=A0A5M9HMV2_9SPHI|nr:hypothetical protein [Arcticibacter tournemirensis]KAA8486811.1 hypothetical protein F1649_00945 [Arcticibacter tournemirensis]TQM49356.1 hypothetical protein BDE36_1057 [Arcticibacter tournemirensis]
MRTSLNEIEYIERHLEGTLNGEEELLFQVNAILNKELAANVQWQQKTLQLVHAYGREQLKQEIHAVHQKLFTQREHLSFRQKILAFFAHS